jgi:hypothetical protein
MDSTPTTTTSFSTRCQILAELWLNYRGDETFQDFVEYNDLGLPLAYAIASDIAISTGNAEMLIDETWELFLGALGVEEDTGFDSLDHILGLEEGE